MAAKTSGETIYEARPPPEIAVDPPVLPPNLELTDAQQKIYDEVLEHFERPDYVLPELGPLTEEEKFWLVRFREAVKCDSLT